MEKESSSKKIKSSNLINQFIMERTNAADSIMHFRFDKKRVRILTSIEEVAEKCKGIVYWMFRDVRVQDNWAFLFAQKVANKNSVPLHVCFCILPTFLNSTMRHYKFLLKGLMEVDAECKQLNINFHLLHGEPNQAILDFVQKYKMGAVITDFFPLRLPLFWLNDLKKKLPDNIPLCQVDAHNIVPCWITSEKLEYSARTIRNKINSRLEDYLTQFPPVTKHSFLTNQKFKKNDWENALRKLDIEESVKEVPWTIPGYNGGILELQSFLDNRLAHFHTMRNNPLSNATSNLSPWFHFGMISVQRCILEVLKYKQMYKESVETFMEEAIVRRELSDNFCFNNEKYDAVEGANQWAIDTLNQHRSDKREYIYNLNELEHSLTHDDLWNSSQIQLVQEGKMHGFLRMYWAKKILEWTHDPEEALKWAIYLNDKYSIDGCDPNGYDVCGQFVEYTIKVGRREMYLEKYDT
ncbi:deoxyribodipyrimidine photo-lyase isoform X2 [Cephus cinctus]|uniref:Deoxyribodipyrimidine photo-lyase n=1 Tax=Cephus cinctus TaxID=211228 RepID=A0AAJ7BGY1_CEPCN|nr:deoxyribodipyrimidine photo-lyase isoform X2 [Cephus cinctus]